MKQKILYENKNPDTGQPLFPESLSPCEVQVAFGLLTDASRKTIAQNLGVVESTVKRHTERIYKKTGCHTRHEFLVKYLSVKN